VGYSVKARGIARDLFGTEENYVLPVQSLDNPKQLTKAFIWLQEREELERSHLTNYLRGYLNKTIFIKEIEMVLNDE
jgi:hypothetical protein